MMNVCQRKLLKPSHARLIHHRGLIVVKEITSNKLLLRKPISKLGMSIVCKDESDVIEENIRFHAAKGVDAFAVLDNGSIDGTFEILTKLSNEFELTIFRDLSDKRTLALWHNQCVLSLKKVGCDWVIPNDADEFWWPNKGSLKTAINTRFDFVRYRRYNLFPDREHVHSLDYAFFNNIFRIEGRRFFVYSKSASILLRMPLLMRQKLGPKVAFCTTGFESTVFGNHSVKTSGFGCPYLSGAVDILHFPVRSYHQFETKVLNHARNLPPLHARTKKSLHLRTLYDIYLQGKLVDEFESMIWKRSQIELGIRVRLIKRDERLRNWFNDLIIGSKPSHVHRGTT